MKEFEYKVGDYVYCYNDNGYSCKGKCYKIESIIFMEYFLNYGNCIFIKMEYDINYWIIEHNNEDFINFYDYFLTKEEYRKLKLEKLYERI